MISELLSRAFLLNQLSQIESYLRGDTSRAALSRSTTEVSAEDVNIAIELLSEARRREESASSGQPGFDSLTMRLQTGAGSLDEHAFFSRDPVMNILQSTLEEYIETHPDDHPLQKIQNLAENPRVATTDQQLVPEGRGFRFLGEFEPTDPGWIAAAVARGISSFRRKHPFKVTSAQFTAPDHMRVILLGDWGTGLPRAQKVASQIRHVIEQGKRQGLSQHVIHLGDVYYSGQKREYENRFLKFWPVKLEEAAEIGSWSLNGNHDMYSGGNAYFEFLLKDPRFVRQQQSSFFRITNAYWDILALDTSWDDARLTERHGVLKGVQIDWLEEILAGSDRKAMLLTHHQPYSVYDSLDDTLEIDPKLSRILEADRILAWFWGHEHRCMLFDPYRHVPFGRCLGNGGVPVYMPRVPSDPYVSPGQFEYRDRLEGSPEPWALFGFAVLDFANDVCQVRYINEDGYKFKEETLQSVTASLAHSQGAPLNIRRLLDSESRVSSDRIVRYPDIRIVSAQISDLRVDIQIDLLLEPNGSTEGLFDLADVSELPSDWDEIPIDVQVFSNAIHFPEGNEGVVLVQRGGKSQPCSLPGILKKPQGDNLSVNVTFTYTGRFCGYATLDIRAEYASGGTLTGTIIGPSTGWHQRQPNQITAKEGGGLIASTPVARSLGAAAASSSGFALPESARHASVSVDISARAPVLTVMILATGSVNSGDLTWVLVLAPHCRSIAGIPPQLTEEIHLGANPQEFIQALYSDFEAVTQTSHVESFGELLYERTPQCFRVTYRALRNALGASFPIQFVTADPHIPWELMRPTGFGAGSALLAETHPVGRWISAYQGSMPARLPIGDVFTIAPDYSSRKIRGLAVRPLPGAIRESEMLQRHFKAVPVAAKRDEVMKVLEGPCPKPVAILHFAGHGEFGKTTSNLSRILLSDDDVTVLDVRREEVVLGKECRTLVIFNACQVGRSGSALGAISGWAEAFLRGGFSGFVAPLWSVIDEKASDVTHEFFTGVLNRGLSPSEALQQIRARYGRKAPTYMSYIYYGDVMATM